MKKIFRMISVISVAVCMGASFAACRDGKGETSYTGEYAYDTEYGKYGFRVNVVVKGDTIERVEIADSDYMKVTESWDGNRVYYEGERALLDSFAGKTVSQVKGYSVTKEEDGTPDAVNADGIALITGATQSSGRLLLAVQNALEKL